MLAEYIEYIANKQLLRYKYIVQYGSKEGESVWTHIMNLVTTIEKLRPLFHLPHFILLILRECRGELL